MSSVLVQDIYKDRTQLIFHPIQETFKGALIPYTHCLAETENLTTLNDNTLFQIVDVRDTTVSTMSLIDTITDMINANEGFQDHYKGNRATRHRPIITSVDINDDHNEPPETENVHINNNVIYRLILQDCFGNLCYAYEEEPLQFLRGPNTKGIFRIELGSKLLVHGGTKVSINTLHLKNENISFLGGRIIKLNYNLYKRKLKELKDEIGYEI